MVKFENHLYRRHEPECSANIKVIRCCLVSKLFQIKLFHGPGYDLLPWKTELVLLGKEFQKIIGSRFYVNTPSHSYSRF